MRLLTIILAIAILVIAGCGGSSAKPTPAPAAPVWHAPQTYMEAVQLAVHPLGGPPPSPGDCWPVYFSITDPHGTIKLHGYNDTLVQVNYTEYLFIPQATLWATVEVPTGYVFQGWVHEGSVGTFITDGDVNATFTTPGTANPNMNSSANITRLIAEVAPASNG